MAGTAFSDDDLQYFDSLSEEDQERSFQEFDSASQESLVNSYSAWKQKKAPALDLPEPGSVSLEMPEELGSSPQAVDKPVDKPGVLSRASEYVFGGEDQKGLYENLKSDFPVAAAVAQTNPLSAPYMQTLDTYATKEGGEYLAKRQAQREKGEYPNPDFSKDPVTALQSAVEVAQQDVGRPVAETVVPALVKGQEIYDRLNPFVDENEPGRKEATELLSRQLMGTYAGPQLAASMDSEKQLRAVNLLEEKYGTTGAAFIQGVSYYGGQTPFVLLSSGTAAPIEAAVAAKLAQSTVLQTIGTKAPTLANVLVAGGSKAVGGGAEGGIMGLGQGLVSPGANPIETTTMGIAAGAALGPAASALLAGGKALAPKVKAIGTLFKGGTAELANDIQRLRVERKAAPIPEEFPITEVKGHQDLNPGIATIIKDGDDLGVEFLEINYNGKGKALTKIIRGDNDLRNLRKLADEYGIENLTMSREAGQELDARFNSEQIDYLLNGRSASVTERIQGDLTERMPEFEKAASAGHLEPRYAEVNKGKMDAEGRPVKSIEQYYTAVDDEGRRILDGQREVYVGTLTGETPIREGTVPGGGRVVHSNKSKAIEQRPVDPDMPGIRENNDSALGIREDGTLEVKPGRAEAPVNTNVMPVLGDMVNYFRGRTPIRGKVVKVHDDGLMDIRFDNGEVKTRANPIRTAVLRETVEAGSKLDEGITEGPSPDSGPQVANESVGGQPEVLEAPAPLAGGAGQKPPLPPDVPFVAEGPPNPPRPEVPPLPDAPLTATQFERLKEAQSWTEQLSRLTGTSRKAMEDAMALVVNRMHFGSPNKRRIFRELPRVGGKSAQETLRAFEKTGYAEWVSGFSDDINNLIDRKMTPDELMTKSPQISKAMKELARVEVEQLHLKQNEALDEIRRAFDMIAEAEFQAGREGGLFDMERAAKLTEEEFAKKFQDLKDSGALDAWTAVSFRAQTLGGDKRLFGQKKLFERLPNHENHLRVAQDFLQSGNPKLGSATIEKEVQRILDARDPIDEFIKSDISKPWRKLLNDPNRMPKPFKDLFGYETSGVLRVAFANAKLHATVNTLKIWNDLVVTDPSIFSRQRLGEFTVPVPNDVVRYGAAAGGYMRDDFKSLLSAGNASGTATKMLRGLFAPMKVSKILLNTGSWVANIIGNPFYAMNSLGLDITRPLESGRSYDLATKALLHDFRSRPSTTRGDFASKSLVKSRKEFKAALKDNDELAAIVLEARRLGVVDAGVGAEELDNLGRNRLFTQLEKGHRQLKKDASGLDHLANLRDSLALASNGNARFIVNGQANLDNVPKLASYISLRQKFVNRGMSLQDAAETAARDVLDSFPVNTSRSGGRIQEAVASAPGLFEPLARFATENVRVMATLPGRMLKDKEVALKMMMNAGIVYGAFNALQYMNRARGITKEYEAALLDNETKKNKSFRPLMFVLPFFKENDEPLVIDASSYIPFAALLKGSPEIPAMTRVAWNMIVDSTLGSGISGDALAKYAEEAGIWKKFDDWKPVQAERSPLKFAVDVLRQYALPATLSQQWNFSRKAGEQPTMPEGLEMLAPGGKYMGRTEEPMTATDRVLGTIGIRTVPRSAGEGSLGFRAAENELGREMQELDKERAIIRKRPAQTQAEYAENKRLIDATMAKKAELAAERMRLSEQNEKAQKSKKLFKEKR